MRLRLIFYLIIILALGLGGIFLSPYLEPVEGLLLRGLSPLQGLTSLASRPIINLADTIGGIGRLSAENERLRQEVARLESEVARLKALGEENQRLKALLNYKEKTPSREFLVASVIGYDPTNLVWSMTINRGRDDGLKEGMVIVAAGGLVGKVTQLFDTSARVLLITDPSSAVSAVVQPSQAQGVVEGYPGGKLVMKYVEQNVEVKEGDSVVTSGRGGGFPPGILIGKLTKVERSDQEVFQRLEVTSALNFNWLEEVFVILNFTPTPL